MINFEKAINFPFAQKNWINTVGIYFLIMLGLTILSGIVGSIFQFPANFLGELSRTENGEALNEIANLSVAVSAMATFVVSFVTFPIYLYLSGYLFNTTRNVMFEVEEPIRPHGELMIRMKYGVARSLIQLLVGITSLVLLAIPSVVSIAAIITTRTMLPIAIILWIFAGLLFMAWLIFSFFILTFAKYSMEYVYLTEGFRSIFNFSKIKNLIQKYWKEFMLLIAIELVGGVAVAMTIITCCLQFIAQPILQTMVSFILAYSFGIVFKKIYSEAKKS